MEDQGKFLELLEDMKGIARAQNNQLTKQEVRDYLGDMELSEKQWQAVYQYLGASHIQIQGYDYVPESIPDHMDDKDMAGTAVNTAGETVYDKPGEDIAEDVGSGTAGDAVNSVEENAMAEVGSARLRHRYQQDLQRLSADRQNVPIQEIEQFLKGDQSCRDLIIESRLHQVVKLARQYTQYSIPLEDLIAEGNLGLLNGMARAESDRNRFILADGSVDLQTFLGFLEQEVIDAIESLINQETESKSQEAAMLAKTNLLHETAKYLAEENGKVPTVEELSEYTRVPVREIRQIMDLSEDTKRVAVITDIS